MLSEATGLTVATAQKPPQRVTPGTEPDWPLGIHQEPNPLTVEIKTKNSETKSGVGPAPRSRSPRVSGGHSSTVWL